VDIRVAEGRREETSEEKEEFKNTSQRRVLVPTSPKTRNQPGGYNTRLRMVNQDTTLRLPLFNGMGKDDAKNNWFTCEAI
jgi:hypothetical protein